MSREGGAAGDVRARQAVARVSRETVGPARGLEVSLLPLPLPTLLQPDKPRLYKYV